MNLASIRVRLGLINGCYLATVYQNHIAQFKAWLCCG